MIFFFDNFKISLRYDFHILNIHRDIFFYLLISKGYRYNIIFFMKLYIAAIFPLVSYRYPIDIPSIYIIYNEKQK
jgi:hypothetical protein